MLEAQELQLLLTLHYEVHKDGRKINPVNFYYNDLNPDEYEKMLEISSQNNQSFD